MPFTRSFDSGWELSLAPLGDQLVARLVRGGDAYELITRDQTMLQLPELGYQVDVGPDQNGDPWVTWSVPAGGPRYVWICRFKTAMWAKDVTGGGVH